MKLLDELIHCYPDTRGVPDIIFKDHLVEFHGKYLFIENYNFFLPVKELVCYLNQQKIYKKINIIRIVSKDYLTTGYLLDDYFHIGTELHEYKYDDLVYNNLINRIMSYDTCQLL